jgi:hypothetical protein
VLAGVFATARAQKYVHMDIRDVAGANTIVFSDNDTPAGGSQRITLDGHPAQVKVIGSTTYFTGDVAALMAFFRLSPAAATRVNGRWVQLSPGDRMYKTVTAGVTIASALNQFRLFDPLRLLPTRTTDGRQVFGIEGAVSAKSASAGRGALSVTTGATQLPVTFLSASSKVTVTASFSAWGQRTTTTAPADTMPASSVERGAPPGVNT